MPILDEIMILLEKAGGERYGGEAINQLEHALQCAMHAERMGSTPELVTACLLHDIGHLVGTGDEGLAAQGVDARHEDIAAVWLQQYFPAAVVEPVRLHEIGRATSELQSLMRISYAVFCLNKNNN